MASTVPVYPPRRLKPDHKHHGVALVQLRPPLTQLRQVLQAVQSPEPPQEDQHDGLPAKVGQRDRFTGGVSQGKVWGAIVYRQGHARVIRRHAGVDQGGTGE